MLDARDRGVVQLPPVEFEHCIAHADASRFGLVEHCPGRARLVEVEVAPVSGADDAPGPDAVRDEAGFALAKGDQEPAMRSIAAEHEEFTAVLIGVAAHRGIGRDRQVLVPDRPEEDPVADEQASRFLPTANHSGRIARPQGTGIVFS